MRRDRWSRDNMPGGFELDKIQSGIDSAMRGAISDAYRGISQSASMLPQSQQRDETPRAPSGGTVPITSPPGIEHIDRMVDAQDRKDRIARLREVTENAWIESHFEKGPRIETEWNPFDAANMKK
jgi:hypothetical protein